MPNIDGLKLIRAIRSITEYKKLPIIILSSLSNDEDINVGLSTGAQFLPD